MGYYLISEDDGKVVGYYDFRPTDEQLQNEADEMQCAIYVIEGQHAGMTAEPRTEAEKMAALGVPTLPGLE